MRIHARTAELMASPVGCAPREIQAMRSSALHSLPQIPGGFGLVGPTGCGKTWALVQHLGMQIEAVVAASQSPGEAKMPYGFRLRWVNWPERAEQIKREIRDTHSLEDWIDMAQECSALYLDDLGRERITGENDYSLGVLSEVIDHRYRHDLPIFWTSNRSPEELGAFYSGRIASRLLGTWPAFGVNGADLRLSPAGVQ